MRTRISEDTTPFSRIFRTLFTLFCIVALLFGKWFAIPFFLLFWYVSEPTKIVEFDDTNIYLLKNEKEELVPLHKVNNLELSYGERTPVWKKNYRAWKIIWRDETGASKSVIFRPTQIKEDWSLFVNNIRKKSPAAKLEQREFYASWWNSDDSSPTTTK